MQRSRRITSGLLAIAVTALVLSACSATPDVTPTPTATAESPAPTKTPVFLGPGTPVPTAAAALTCDTALDQGAYDDFAGSNLVQREFTKWWGSDLQFMLDDGGLVCLWGNEGDVMVVFGQLAVADAEWETLKASLLDAGYTVDNTTFNGYLNEPDTDPNYVDGGFLHHNGQLYYASYPGVLQWVPGLQG
jgi:hypothetical protein